MKILITDIFFPTNVAHWRINEINSFILDHHVDVIVNKSPAFLLDEIQFHTTLLDGYNILIFNKKFNFLNKYNKSIDGRKFNNKKNPFSYLLTKGQDFSLSSYQLVYHIFLMNYFFFNRAFKFDYAKQAIHLYPGGGYGNFNMKVNVSNLTKLIPTQRFITDNLVRQKKTNYQEVMLGTFLPKGYEISPKEINYHHKLRIAFTAISYDRIALERKGYYKYLDLINFLNEQDLAYEFFCIGVSERFQKKVDNLTYIGLMNYKELDQFYHEKVDIKINLQSGGMDGWPLGTEAMLQGVILILTDHNHNNDKNEFNFVNGEDCFLLEQDYNFNEICDTLQMLDADRDLLGIISKNCQEKIFELVKYENQQQKIYKFLGLENP